MTKHGLPWRVEGRSIMRGMGERVAEVGYSESSKKIAQFIVRAVNSQDETLEALKSFAPTDNHMCPAKLRKNEPAKKKAQAGCRYCKARAAIAKADEVTR